MTISVQTTFQFTNVQYQYYATIAANLLALSQGCLMGWVSPAVPILASNNTSLLSGPLNNEEISWIGSISSIGALFGSISLGYLTALMGSKRVLLLLGIPIITFWLLIFFGNMYYQILIARFICGCTGGTIYSAIILFVSEIANDNVRGRLGSIMLVFRNVGTLIGYILGAHFEYKYVPCISVIIPIVFIVIFLMIPNTPQFYLQRGQIQKAENALKLFKGHKGNSQHEDDAIAKEFDRLKANIEERKRDETFQLADFCNCKALKGLGIGMALIVFSHSTAAYTIVTYAVTTLAKAGTTIDPYKSSIALAVAQCIGSLVSTYLADKLGRKILILMSLLGSACGLLATAFYNYMLLIGFNLSLFAWVPMVCLSFVLFISSCGIIPLAIVCCVEHLPRKIRTHGMAIIAFGLSLTAFITAKMFPILLEHIDLHGTLTIYGIGCIIGFIFVFFVLAETSGKPLDDLGTIEMTNRDNAPEQV